MTITQRGVNNVEKEQSEEMDFEEIWKPIKSVIGYQRMDYGEAVTIGGQFGILKKEIKSLQQQNKRYCEVVKVIKKYANDCIDVGVEMNPHLVIDDIKALEESK